MTNILIKTIQHTCFALPESLKRRIVSSIEETSLILRFVLILLPQTQKHELFVAFVFSSNNSAGRIFLPCESLVHKSSKVMQPRLKKPLYVFWTFASILQQLTLQVRKHRDVRPNDGFLRQLVEFDTRYCSPEILLQSYGRLNLCISGENLKRQILIILSLFRLKSERGLLASTARAWMDCLLWFDFSDLTSPPNPSPAPPPPPPAPPPPPPPAPPPPPHNIAKKFCRT